MIFGFLLYPIYALPWIIKSIAKNELLGFVLYSLLMAYLAYLMIPLVDDDLTRHYESYVLVSSMNLEQIMSLYPMRFVFYIYIWVLSHLGFSKEFMPFSITFLMYMFYFLSLRRVLLAYNQHSIENINTISFHGLLLLGFFMIVNEMRFVIDTSGLRNSLAFSIFIFALVSYYLDKKKLSTVFLFLLSLLVHIAILPLILIFILANFIQFNKVYRIIFIISLLLLFSGIIPMIYSFILDLITPFLKSQGLYISGYLDINSKYGPSFYVGKSLSTVIYGKIIKPLPFYLAGVYIFTQKEIVKKQMENFLYLSFTFIAIVSITKTMMDRYSYFFVLFFIFVLLLDLRGKVINNFKKIFITLFISSLLLMDLTGIYKYKNIFISSWAQTFYIPAPFMFLRQVDPKNYIERPD